MVIINCYIKIVQFIKQKYAQNFLAQVAIALEAKAVDNPRIPSHDQWETRERDHADASTVKADRDGQCSKSC